MISSKNKSIIDDILKWKENSYLEFKRIQKKPKELLESIIALSNTEWWLLILGLADEKQWQSYERLIWVNENIENLAELKKLLTTSIIPPLTNINFIELEYFKNNILDKIIVINIIITILLLISIIIIYVLLSSSVLSLSYLSSNTKWLSILYPSIKTKN